MGDLKRAVEKPFNYIGNRAGQFYHDAMEGSKQIAEKLGYQKAGITPKSQATQRAELAAQPQVIPMPDDDELLKARRRRAASSVGTTGRASTILSDDSDRLGP